MQCLADVPPCPTNLAGFQAAGGSVNDTNVTYRCTDGPLVGDTCGGTITRTHTVFDECTNTASCQQIITINDTIPPVITCPTNVTRECRPGPVSTNGQFCTYTQGGWHSEPMGNNPGTILTNGFDQVYPAGFVEVGIPGPGGFSMQFTSPAAIRAYLPAGGMPKALSMDATNPVNTSAGVFGGQVLALQLNVDFSDAGFTQGPGGPVGDLILNDSSSPFFNQTVRQILAVANQALGGGDISSYGVTISELNMLVDQLNMAFDNCRPSPWAQMNLRRPSDSIPPSPGTGVATATDNCEPDPMITFTDVATPGGCPGSQVIERTWVATDACGNSNTCKQIIGVDDSIPPLITCPSNLTVQCLGNVPPCSTNLAQFVALGGRASDNCDTNLNYSCSDGPLTGGICGGTISRTHKVTDDCTNMATCVQIITVRDTIPPTITCPTNITVQCVGNVPPCPTDRVQFLAQGGTASDNCDTNLQYFCADGPLMGSACGGTIARTHTVVDDCTNSASCVQIITVKDTTPPMLVGVPTNRTFQCLRDVPPAATVTATDNCATNVVVTRVSTTNGSCPTVIVHTWTATDICTNRVSASQTNTVGPATLGFASGPSNVTNCVGTDVQFCAAVTSSCPFTLQWFKNGSAISGATNNCLLLNNISQQSAGTYCIVARGECGSRTNCATLTIGGGLSAVGPTNALVCEDMTADLCTVAQGAGPFVYQWFKNGSPIAGATNACLTVINPGQYCVRVSGACGSVTNCATVILATIHIITLANPPEGGSSGGDIFATNGQPVMAVATPTNDFIFLHWKENNSIITTSKVYSFTATANRTLVAHFAREYCGQWKLDDGSGTTALDSSDSGNHGRLTNGPLFTAAGRVGGALSFDGVNDHVVVPDADSVEFANRKFTVGLWVKTTKTGPQALMEKEHTSFSGFFLLALNRDNAVPGGFSVWNGANWIDSNFRGVTDGQWHHLVVSYDGTTFRLYRDGQLDKAQAANASYVTTSFPLNFGRFVTGNSGWFFSGLLDEIICTSRALSLAEIAALAAGSSPGVVCTLTMTSVNPTNGVTVTVSPNDTNGLGNGSTLFQRTYTNNPLVTLTAPATASGNTFVKWQRDGADWSTNLTTTLTINTNRTMTAIYQAPAPAHISNVRVLGAGQILLEGAGARFGLYHLEASTNLTDWNVIGAAQANGEGAFQFIDENTAEFPARFYRLVAP